MLIAVKPKVVFRGSDSKNENLQIAYLIQCSVYIEKPSGDIIYLKN